MFIDEQMIKIFAYNTFTLAHSFIDRFPVKFVQEKSKQHKHTIQDKQSKATLGLLTINFIFSYILLNLTSFSQMIMSRCQERNQWFFLNHVHTYPLSSVTFSSGVGFPFSAAIAYAVVL